jgi:chaperonin GroES
MQAKGLSRPSSENFFVDKQKNFPYFTPQKDTMDSSNKKILLVGDRVLISPEQDQERTSHGLYLPPGVKEKEKVQSGYIAKVGPGYPVVNPNFIEQEPWSTTPKDPVKYIPLQAEEGDYTIFLRDAAIEIEYEGEQYLIVQQSSLLMLIRRSGFPGIGA